MSKITMNRVRMLIAKVEANYNIGDIVEIKDFDELCIETGLMPEECRNVDPDDRNSEAWLVRTSVRNRVLSKMKTNTVNWMPPFMLVMEDHGKRSGWDLGKMKMVDASGHALATIKTIGDRDISTPKGQLEKARRLLRVYAGQLPQPIERQLEMLVSHKERQLEIAKAEQAYDARQLQQLEVQIRIAIRKADDEAA